jgi:hypothetical protein
MPFTGAHKNSVFLKPSKLIVYGRFFIKKFQDSVLVEFKRSLEMFVRLGDKLGQIWPLFNIGEISYIRGDYAKAGLL